MDRIDIHIEVVPVPFGELSEMKAGENSKVIRERVIKARKIQEIRFEGERNMHCNAQVSSRFQESNSCGMEVGTASSRLTITGPSWALSR